MRVYLLLAFCGLSFAHTNYIFGGDEVTVEGKWPWQGSIRRYGVHHCGIVLISPRKGLTTAHCVHRYPLDKLEFMFGSTNRSDNTVVARARSITIHEDYNWGEAQTFQNNTALVEFDRAIVGKYIEPIPITAKDRDPADNPDCWVTGWGMKDHSQNMPVILREALITIFHQYECKIFWGEFVGDGEFCAGDTINKRVFCEGDDGGPIVCKVFGQYELVGMGSWGIMGCDPKTPFVATRIAYFRDWIRRNAGI